MTRYSHPKRSDVFGATKRTPFAGVLALSLFLAPACAITSGGQGAAKSGVASQTGIQRLEIAKLVDKRTVDLTRFLDLSASSSPVIRSDVARGLGRLQTPDAIPILATLVNDASPKVRGQAIFALGQIDRQDATRILLDHYATETQASLKPSILRAMGQYGDASTAPLLVEALNASDASLNSASATTLGVQAYRKRWDSGFSSAISAGLIRVLKEGDTEAQRAAAYAFSRGVPHADDSEAANAALLELLTNGVPRVRESSLLALAKLGNPADAQTILPLLTDPSWNVRVNAIRALAKLGGDNAAAMIRPALDDANPLVQEACAQTLATTEDTRAADWLIPLLDSQIVGVRTSALSTIATLQGKDALPLLKRMSDDDSPWMRSEAAAALATLETAKADAFLMSLAQSELDPRVMLQIAAALGERSKEPGVFETLEKMLLPADASTTTVIAMALGELGRSDALPPLISAYKRQRPGKDFESQIAIIEAFEALNGPESLLKGLLESALDDPTTQVNEAAANALKNLYGIEAAAAFPMAVSFPMSAEAYAAVNDLTHAWILTSRGSIEVDLYPDKAPITVANFERLAKQGFYDGLTWHRVVPNFVAQTGSPRGDGWGGPGYAIRCEIGPEGYTPGTLGMALSGKDTGGSQFFITHTDTPHLDGTYTIFGRVTEGMDVLDSLLRGDTIRSIRFEQPLDTSEDAALDAISPF